MAVMEISHKNGKLVRLPYDFGETDEATVAAQQYLELFYDDITDAHIVPGNSFPVDQTGYKKSLIELAVPREMLLELLHSNDFNQKEVARIIKVSPRRLSYYVESYNLRTYCQKMRDAVKKTRLPRREKMVISE